MADSRFLLYPTTTAKPMAGGALSQDLSLSYSSVGMPSQDGSLGGYRAGIPLLPELFVPNFNATESTSLEGAPETFVRPSSSEMYQMFGNATSAERTAGSTKHRGFALKNEGPDSATTANLWFESQPRSGIGTIAVGVEAFDALNRIQTITTENGVPAAVVFTSPTLGVPLALGTIAADGVIGIWFRRTLGAGVAAYPWDSFIIAIQPTGQTPQYFTFYYSLLQEEISRSLSTFVGANDGRTITSPEGEVYTLTTKNGSSVATDVIQNAVYLFYTTTMYSPRYTPKRTLFDQYAGVQPTMTFQQPYIRTGTGIYRAHFRPPHPGHYHLVTDVASEVRIERSVTVSPVGDRT